MRQDPTAAAIETRGLTKVFGSADGGVRALDEVSLTIAGNQFFTLLGPSGCGKTTLLRLVAGFEQPTSGQVLLDGVDIVGEPPYRRPVNTVFQSYALFPHMTVAQNVGFGLEMNRKPPSEIGETVERMLALVRLQGMGGRYPDQLSGGQQQRVALARALANRPRVLLLDEPLSALDLKLRKDMQIELKRLQNETGVTFVFVTHDQQEALTMSDGIAVMDSGKILQIGSPSEIYETPVNRFVADFIGETNLLTARLIARNGEEGRYRLDAGGELTGALRNGQAIDERVTLAIRPERAELVKAAAGGQEGIGGAIEQIVYFGTDTQYRVRVTGSDTVFLVRRQNRGGADGSFSPGDAVIVTVPPAAVRALAD